MEKSEKNNSGITQSLQRELLRLQARVEEQLTSYAMLLCSIPVTAKAGTIALARIVPLSDSIMDTARVDAKFREYLTRALDYGVYSALLGQLVVLTGMIAMAYGINFLAPFGFKMPEEEKQETPEGLDELARAMLFQQLQSRQEAFKNEGTEQR